MKKIVISTVAAACVLSLGVGLVGCSCSSTSVSNTNNGSTTTQSANSTQAANSSTSSATATGFAGSWVCKGGNYSDVVLTADALSQLGDRGMHGSAVLNEDGTATFDTFGLSSTGTWKKTSDSVATVTIGDAQYEASLNRGVLTIEFDGYLLEYEKGDPVASTVSVDGANEAIIASAVTDVTGESIYTNSTRIDKSVASDGTTAATIVTKAQDEAGLAGFTLLITNNTDHNVEATVKPGTFTVNGKQVDPFLDDVISAGESAECFVFFFENDVQGVDSLVNVQGTIWLLDMVGEDDQEINVEF